MNDYGKLNIVSIDDNSVNLLLIEKMASDIGFNVMSFSNPLIGLDYINKNNVDVIIVDYMMPEMHGVDFVRHVRAVHYDIPIIMITAVVDNSDLKLEAIEAGATEFLNKPVNPAEFKARMRNMAQLRISQLMLRDKALLLQSEVDKAVSTIRDREQEALNVLGRAAEYKDPETATHIMRVAQYSKMIMEAIGGDDEELELILFAAPLHDIGKIGIPDNILNKCGSLTNDEFEIMKTHTYKGSLMLQNTRSKFLRAGGEVALTHHERFDGKGYPKGLAGMDIPLIGRIVAIADVFDAVMSKRPYKEPWPIERAINLVRSERGKHFDPKLVDVFLDNITNVESIRFEYVDA